MGLSGGGGVSPLETSRCQPLDRQTQLPRQRLHLPHEIRWKRNPPLQILRTAPVAALARPRRRPLLRGGWSRPEMLLERRSPFAQPRPEGRNGNEQLRRAPRGVRRPSIASLLVTEQPAG